MELPSKVPLVLSLLCCIFKHNEASNVHFPTVRVSTPLGEIQGSFLQTEAGIQFPAFRGIPYAEPPLGDLRFKKPEPVEKWEGVLDATEDGPVCPQLDAFSKWYFGEEDCLVLNVYTPKLPTKEIPANKPVMVWIHGGGFFWGSGNSDLYGPAKLLSHDVILVTFNYRLGPFGFLSTGDEVAPGNYGLWDQIEALRWVKANIRYFGGDPNQVTIFGESAGGYSVGALVISPAAEGLFHRAISQSGTATCLDLGSPEYSRKRAELLANRARCPTASSQELIDCLRNVPAADLILYYNPSVITADNLPGAPFYPVLDGELLTSSPLKALKSGAINKVPYMAGTTEDEGEFVYNIFPWTVKNQAKETIKANMLSWLEQYGFTREPEMVDQMLDKYFPNLETITEDEARSALIQFYGDVFFIPCTHRSAMEVSKHGVPTYVYTFDHKAEYYSLNTLILKKDSRGVPHFDDIGYLFDAPGVGLPKFIGKDKEVQERFLTLWTNFAKTGSPTQDNRWEPVDPSKPSARYYRFSLDAMDDDRLYSRHQQFYDAYADRVYL